MGVHAVHLGRFHQIMECAPLSDMNGAAFRGGASCPPDAHRDCPASEVLTSSTRLTVRGATLGSGPLPGCKNGRHTHRWAHPRCRRIHSNTKGDSP